MTKNKASREVTAHAQVLAARYSYAVAFLSKGSQDAALRAYERYVAKLGFDPLV